MGNFKELGKINYIDSKASTSNMAMCTFSFSFKNKGKSKDGSTKYTSFKCIAFGKTAENILKYFANGDRIIIDGNIQSNDYEKDGQKVVNYQLTVTDYATVDYKAREAEVEAPPFDV